jgi:NIMA (never in mitosis gene a)-related kinase
MKIDQSDQEDIEYFLQETKILAVCQHPNIVRYYSSFFEKDSWYIQMEFCPLNLLQLLEKDILPISRKCLIILDIVRGIQYLHSLHYIHFDLKPDNILLQGQTAKIADFGLSMLKRNCSDQDNIGGSIYCPAFLTKLTPYIDIYAVGVITMEMFCPVFTTNMEKMIVLREKIMQKDYHLLKGQSQYSRILTRFLELCFCPNTTIDDICSLLGIGKIMN